MNKVVLFVFVFNLFSLFASSLSKDDAGDTSDRKGASEARMRENAAIAKKLTKRGLREGSSQIENSPKKGRGEIRANTKKKMV